MDNLASKALIALLASAVCPLLSGNGSSADTAVINETQRLSSAGGDIGLQQYETSIRDRIKAADDGLFNANDISALPSDLRARLNAFLNSGWLPSDLPSLVVWYRSDTLTTSGSDVTQWTDKSGNGHHLANSDSNEQPDLTSAAINGHDAVTGDGVNDSLFSSSGGITLTRPFHVFAVCRVNTYSSGNYVIIGTSSGTKYFFYAFDSGGSQLISEVSGNVKDTTSPPTSWVFAETLVESGASASTLTTDKGVTTDTGTITADPTGSTDLWVLGRGDGSNANDADIAEIIICNEEITGDDLTNLRDYALTRYGL